MSKSCRQYASLAPTVKLTCDFARSSITLYFGSCVPCCSDMQNLGDRIVFALSCCDTRDGLESHPFSYSAIDMSQHLRCRVGAFGRSRCRRIVRFRVTRLILTLSIPVVGANSRFVIACDCGMLPVMPIPFVRSVDKCLSG